MPGRNCCTSFSWGLLNSIFTGMRCTTFTKLPDALSGGSSANLAPVAGENEVTFEIRTRAPDGSWSEWREIGFAEMKEPIHAETPQSVAWQFRVSLFAHDAASSPKVEAVSVEPLAATALDFSANNTQ